MSLYGALFSGVSGLSSQASAMGAISDNVTNVNTIGYKGTKVNFQTLITKQVSLTKYSPGGVQSKPRAQIDVQGLLQSTSSATDIGMSGQGFFVVNAVSDPAAASGGFFGYTRAGSFKADKQGFLQNASGFYLQGWPLIRATSSAPASSILTIEDTNYMRSYINDDGTYHYVNANIVSPQELKGLNLNTIGGTATATAAIRMGANLPSEDPIYDPTSPDNGGQHQTSILIYDSLGNPHNTDFTWTKTATNTWNIEAAPPPHSTVITAQFVDGAGTTTNYWSQGQIEFAGDFSSSAITGINGDSIQINGTSYDFSSADSPCSTGLIEIGGCNSWGDLVARIKTAIDFTEAAATTSYNGYQDNAGRFFQDGASTNRLLIRQYSTQAAVSIAGAVDATSNGLALYLRQYSQCNTTDGTSYSVQLLDAGANFYDQSTIDFNGNGTPDNINVNTLDIRWANGAQNMDGATSSKPSIFLGNQNLADGMTQLSGNYQVTYITQDGAKFGNFSGVSIGDDGVVTALFDNGVRRPVYQIPVATFVNPNGMESLTGNTFIETDTSGAYTLRSAKEAGAGSIASASLESSTVDLGEEFTNMIVTQRAYSASAKIITTSDQMLDELVNIKR
ncbi:conserved exported hypothetical protein [Rhodospirillaceae bacterium LM-1]|nr:conserved exported hypothetical protein [Rhodospirillaceae bacterium LM-1]